MALVLYGFTTVSRSSELLTMAALKNRVKLKRYAMSFCRLNIFFIQCITNEYAEIMYAHICCVLVYAM